MSHPYHHAVSSANRHGGKPEDYQAIHDWFDASKSFMCDFRHRALRHHAEGIFECERVFGVTITTSSGRKVPTRLIGEQHVREDLGFVPSLQDWLSNLKPQPWMRRGAKIENLVEPVVNPVRHRTAGEATDGREPRPDRGDAEALEHGPGAESQTPDCPLAANHV